MKRFQFSIRTLLIFMLAVACLLLLSVEWFDGVRAEFYAEQEAARRIEEYGGSVRHTPCLPAVIRKLMPQTVEPGYFDRISTVWLPVKSPHPGKTRSQLLSQLKILKQLTWISISGSFHDDIYSDEPMNSEDFDNALPGVRISHRLQ